MFMTKKERVKKFLMEVLELVKIFAITIAFVALVLWLLFL